VDRGVPLVADGEGSQRPWESRKVDEGDPADTSKQPTTRVGKSQKPV
jgi:hypothetical protein